MYVGRGTTRHHFSIFNPPLFSFRGRLCVYTNDWQVMGRTREPAESTRPVANASEAFFYIGSNLSPVTAKIAAHRYLKIDNVIDCAEKRKSLLTTAIRTSVPMMGKLFRSDCQMPVIEREWMHRVVTGKGTVPPSSSGDVLTKQIL